MKRRLFILPAALPALVLGVHLTVAALGGQEECDYFQSADFKRPMRSVELQYFRVPRERWELLLTRMAQYNADTISTYVHWGFHEYEEGRFDFKGETLPERDLIGFIELCGTRGFFVVLKPGPFIDAETKAGGIPAWLIDNYPETVAINRKGKPFIHGDSGLARISYLHPTYLKLVARYYEELGRAVARYQWPQGPIVAVQVDNETPGDGFVTLSNYLTYNFKADYNEYYRESAWPEWLEKKYKTIERLNQDYGSSYSSFSQVPMLNRWGDPQDEKEFQIYIDLDQFAEWQYVEGLRRFTALLRDAGFHAPTYQDFLCMPWDMAGLLGDMGGMAEASGGWIGNNVYAEVYRPWTVFVGNPAYKYNFDEYVHMAAWRTRLAGTLSEPWPAFVPEISCSQRFYFQAPVAFGADALNVYVGWQTPVDNELTSPRGSWGMEACVTIDGQVRDCFWNAKNTYLFMEHSGAFLPGAKRPGLALGYSHWPEHAWNWEFKFNFDLPHDKVRHPRLLDIVQGANTGDRTQLIARELVLRDVDFDVIHMDHLKPGRLESYELVVIPTSKIGPAPGFEQSGQQMHLSPGSDDWEEVSTLDWEKYRQAWADSEAVDVIQRCYRPDRPTVISIVNRDKIEFMGPAHFLSGAATLQARIGPKAIGFVSVQGSALKAAVIDHQQGLGEYRYGDDLMAFTGTFAAMAVEPGYALMSALDAGQIMIKSRLLDQPRELVRLSFDGRVEAADFEYRDGVLSFDFEPAMGGARTDLYILLGPGIDLEDAIGDYLKRSAIR